MYVWSFALSRASASTGPAAVFGDARVVARREPRGAEAVGQVEHRIEAQHPVAADARVGSAPGAMLGHEVRNDAVAERLDAGRASRAGSPIP